MSYQKRYFAIPVVIASVISAFFCEFYSGDLNRIEYGLICLLFYIICILIYWFFSKKESSNSKKPIKWNKPKKSKRKK